MPQLGGIVMTASKKIAGAALLGQSVLVGCAATLHDMPVGTAQRVTDWPGIHNVFRDDRIFFAGQPTAEAFRQAPSRNIKLVIDLRAPEEMAGSDGFDEAALAEALGMEYVSLPITGETFSAERADELRQLLERSPGPAMIHCASSNRVGALWALYLHRHRGIGLDEAIARGQAAGMTKAPLVESVRRVAQNQ
jgi:uncharacterized protein (TIGR01244 family)